MGFRLLLRLRSGEPIEGQRRPVEAKQFLYSNPSACIGNGCTEKQFARKRVKPHTAPKKYKVPQCHNICNRPPLLVLVRERSWCLSQGQRVSMRGLGVAFFITASWFMV